MAKLRGRKIILFSNTDWYLYNFRMSLLLKLQSEGADLLLISPPGPYGTRLQALGFRWCALKMLRRSLNPFRELRLLVELASLFRAEKPDIVHGFTIKCAVYGAIVARLVGVGGRVSAINGMGYVYTSGEMRALLLRPMISVLMKLAFGGRASRVIVQNPDDQAAIKDAGISVETIRLIPGSGVDLRRFRPTTRARGENDPFRVVMPARLLWDKGIREFVEAARLLKGHGFEFQVAGDADPGNPAAVPLDILEAWRTEGHVTFLGHVDDIATTFAAADAVVLPSYREGLPKALIEAGACGLPLVTVDVPGCRDVVTDGIDGLLLPPKNHKRLAEAMCALKQDADLAKRLGTAARAKAVQTFDDKIIVRRTIEVYDELVPL